MYSPKLLSRALLYDAKLCSMHCSSATPLHYENKVALDPLELGWSRGRATERGEASEIFQ